jgi:metal-dependent amidase/aminoacylase/carboxypeptidase family protein
MVKSWRYACLWTRYSYRYANGAEVLASIKKRQRNGKFIFQPAEEGAPDGEEGGAELMVKEGVLNNPKVDVIFGLHIAHKPK